MQATKEETLSVFSFLAASPSIGDPSLTAKNSRLGLAASETGTHQAFFAGNSWTALGMTVEVRRNGVGLNCNGEEITTTANDTYKFAQLYRDSDSGLDYAQARYYASGVGRFLTADPSGNMSTRTDSPQTWNKYAYTTNDPVNKGDPLGLDSEGPPPDPAFLMCPDGSYIFYGGSNCGSSTNSWGWSIGVPTFSITVSAPLFSDHSQEIAGMVKSVEDAFKNKPECAGLFNTDVVDPAKFLDTLQSAGQVTSGYYPLGNNLAVTVPQAAGFGIPLVEPGNFNSTLPLISFNTQDQQGSVFTGAYGNTIDNNTVTGTAWQGTVLIHELIHAVQFKYGAIGSTHIGAGSNNLDEIYRKCFK